MQRDESTFLDALALSWLIGATDAHAKNFSLLIAANDQVRLAPLYDLASILPHPKFDVHRVKLAIKIGGEYRLSRVGLREWGKLAAELRMEAEEAVASRIAAMARAIPDHLADIDRRIRSAGLEHPLIPRLMDRLAARSRLCASQLRRS